MKVYYCPKCHRKISYDKHYVLVVCRRCNEEMFEFIDGKIKGEYVVEVDKDGRPINKEAQCKEVNDNESK